MLHTHTPTYNIYSMPICNHTHIYLLIPTCICIIALKSRRTYSVTIGLKKFVRNNYTKNVNMNIQ